MSCISAADPRHDGGDANPPPRHLRSSDQRARPLVAMSQWPVVVDKRAENADVPAFERDSNCPITHLH